MMIISGRPRLIRSMLTTMMRLILYPGSATILIHLGTIENFKGKLRNLEAFYEKVLPEVGWNKYSVINLEFKDQIVCKKR